MFASNRCTAIVCHYGNIIIVVCTIVVRRQVHEIWHYYFMLIFIRSTACILLGGVENMTRGRVHTSCTGVIFVYIMTVCPTVIVVIPTFVRVGIRRINILKFSLLSLWKRFCYIVGKLLGRPCWAR